jgi:AcrR family transcriptional regulator
VAALLDAAVQVFEEKGFDAATMTEIAARAQASIGSLYQFFPSKDVLAQALLERYATFINSALAELAAKAASVQAQDIAHALVDMQVQVRANRAVALNVVDARTDAAVVRGGIREQMVSQIASILLAWAPTLGQAQAQTMAMVVLQVLKAVPHLAEEKQGAARLLAETETMIQLYLQQARA